MFNCLCIVGIADLANLLVFALVTEYFSDCLVSILVWFSGNISQVFFSLFVHFMANFRLRNDLLALSVCRFVILSALL